MTEDAKSRNECRGAALRRKSMAAAIEITFALTLSNTALAANFVTNLNDAGPGSLRQAVANANGSGLFPAIVQFQTGLTGTITLTTGEIPITQSVNVEGPGANAITVSAGGTSRIFNAQYTGSSPVTISGLTLQNGYSATTGGAVNVSAPTFAMNNCVIQNSVADTQGAGLYVVNNASTTLSGDTFSNNQGPTGCGFLVISSQATITGIVSENNICSTRGGGGETQGTTTITASQFLNNSGGGLYARGIGSVYIANSTVIGNSSTGYGGGIGASKVSGVTIVGSAISGNYSAKSGGGLAVLAAQGDTSIVHSTFDNNRTRIVGGVKSASSGGGISVRNNSNTTAVAIQSSTISNNQAGNGAGIFMSSMGVLNVSMYDTTIASNTAQYSFGGAVIEPPVGDGSVLTVESTTIASNSSQNVGGIDASKLISRFHDSIVANNILTKGTQDPDIRGIITANYSLFGNAGDAAITGTGNLIGVDPMLGSLGDYGGGIATMLPLSGSPVINAGDPAFDPEASPALDERGLPRVVGSAIDIGAVEVQAVEDTIFLNGFESG
jgi:hypothetical protein